MRDEPDRRVELSSSDAFTMRDEPDMPSSSNTFTMRKEPDMRNPSLSWPGPSRRVEPSSSWQEPTSPYGNNFEEDALWENEPATSQEEWGD